LWEAQREPGYKRKWWQDGEYDSARADAANDRGTEFYKKKEYSQAFDCFTEAIRLCPTSPVYHCNRAAVALHLGQFAIAAQDAEEAWTRDRSFVKAWVRGAKAHTKLQNPVAARRCYHKALELDTSNTTAKAGLNEVEALEARLKEREAHNQAYAAQGNRPPLPRSLQCSDQSAGDDFVSAGQLLYVSSEQMLTSHPDLESAKCSKVEALIMCGRYSDALSAIDELREGPEKVYLRAEAEWRKGDVSAALATLRSSKYPFDRPDKCRTLELFLAPIHENLTFIESESSCDGSFSQILERATLTLANLHPALCCGLYCKLTRWRAEAALQLNNLSEALIDLDEVLKLQEWDVSALRARAKVHKRAGRGIEYFLDVQRLQKLDPQAPDISSLLQDAARCASSADSNYVRFPDGTAPEDSGAARILHIDGHATAAEVRKAYLKLAAAWHPDKWAKADESKRLESEEQFKRIQAAYEALTISQRSF
jgi:tetratricopeptide (TPR) repeat protein